MKNIFVKYVAPAFIVLTAIGHIYTSYFKGLPECDSSIVKHMVEKLKPMGEENVFIGKVVADGKPTSDDFRECAVSMTLTDDYGVDHVKAFYFTLVWKDAKKKHVVFTNVRHY